MKNNTLLSVLLVIFTAVSFGSCSSGAGQESANRDMIKVHTVKKGETLYGIAKMYGTSLSELLRLNNGLAITQKDFPVLSEMSRTNDTTVVSSDTTIICTETCSVLSTKKGAFALIVPGQQLVVGNATIAPLDQAEVVPTPTQSTQAGGGFCDWLAKFFAGIGAFLAYFLGGLVALVAGINLGGLALIGVIWNRISIWLHRKRLVALEGAARPIQAQTVTG